MVFDDELDPSVASSSDYEGSEDSFYRARKAAAAGGGGGVAVGSGKSLGYDGSSKSGGVQVQQTSPESTIPSSTSPTPPRYGGRHGVAAVAVAGWGNPKQTASKGRPVELAMPLSRSPVVDRAAAAAAGGGRGGGSGRNRPAFSAPEDSSDDDDREAWRRAARGEHASAASRAGSASVSRGRSRRSNDSSNGRSGHHHHHHHRHHHHHDDALSQVAKSRPSRWDIVSHECDVYGGQGFSEVVGRGARANESPISSRGGGYLEGAPAFAGCVPLNSMLNTGWRKPKSDSSTRWWCAVNERVCDTKCTRKVSHQCSRIYVVPLA